MGLRGPGAKPIRKLLADNIADNIDNKPHAWEAEGLSRAERVMVFCESLPVTSGTLAGTTFKLRPWQKRFLKAVYACDRSGKRKVRTAVLSMARKNGKTDIAARLALCHLCGPEAEQRGEIYSAANDRFQAGRIFSEVVAIIEWVPWLSERVSVRRHSKELEDIGGTGSTYAALSADVATKHGLSPSFVCYDELGQASSRELYDVLDTAMGARAEPLMVVISTQAASDHAPMSELVDYGLKVNAGTIADPSFHLTFFAASDDADPWQESTWRKANPALGDFRSLDDVRRLASQAQRMPSREASFRNLILNQRVDGTAQFLTAGVWKACGGAVDLDKLKGRPCWAAFDFGAVRDLSALVLVFQDDDGGFDVLPFFWLPDDGLRDREEQDRVPYCLWRDQGHLQTMPGKTNDPAFIARKIAELHGQFDIRALAYDRWRIEDLRRELAAVGCDVPLEAHGQGFKDMGPAVEALERCVTAGTLRHGMHPLLTWNIGNAVAVADPAGNRKLAKDKSHGRIDGVVAIAMALNIATRQAGQGTWEPLCITF